MEINAPALLRITPGCLKKIGKYLRNTHIRKCAIIYGEGIRNLVGESVETSLMATEITALATYDVSSNDLNQTITHTFALPGQTEAVLGIGGGKAIDVAKYMAFIHQIPYFSIPTSIANDSIASPQVSLSVDGRRRSLKAAMPHAVIVDTQIIAKSPAFFTLSGIGDIMAKYTAIHDWQLAYNKNQTPVNDFAVLISLQSVENLANYPNKNIGDLEFLRVIAGCLVMSGLAMSVSGSSRPASGAEHLISHGYDLIAAKPTLHGIQVAVSTLAVSWLQKNPKDSVIRDTFEKTGLLDYIQKNPLEKESFIQAILKAPSIKENYFTILSEKDNVEKLLSFVKTDALMNRLLR